jgi:predicted metalloprotease with PDZ domain
MRLTMLALLTSLAAFAQGPVRLRVDASDASRRLFHVQMTMAVKPGPVSLLYPEWIPGEHGPTGPIINLVGLRIVGGGRNVAWKRDDVNMFAFHMDVPEGVTSLDIAFDFISPPEGNGFTSTASATSELAVLNWNQVLLYPQGTQPDDLQYQATLRVPNGWKYGTALPIAREMGRDIEFQPASLTTLIDSPISAGAHYRTIELGTDNGISHFLHVAADSDRALEVGRETIAEYQNLVKEAGALFGARHYRDYHFLFTLSDHVAHFGLEHHESSDDREGERSLIDADKLRTTADLLPHEFVHSWNGKFRRPKGLISGDHDGGYDTPMKGELLWVYEGLTEYLGEVLAARSSLFSADDYRDKLAMTAAALDREYGRQWRPLADTAVSAPFLYEAGSDYGDYRRGVDFYPEGVLIWLDVDVTLRQLSKGTKSLDDFCRAFEGGAGGAPALKPYDMTDVVATLKSIQPYDWEGFLNDRLHYTSPHAPMGGIEHGGWKLTYSADASDYFSIYEEGADMSFSVGMKIKEDGLIADVLMNTPAGSVGITPATHIIAVNNRQFTITILREAIQKAVTDMTPIELLIKNGEYFKTYKLDYHGGEKFPHLTRVDNTADLLSDILAPKAGKK